MNPIFLAKRSKNAGRRAGDGHRVLRRGERLMPATPDNIQALFDAARNAALAAISAACVARRAANRYANCPDIEAGATKRAKAIAYGKLDAATQASAAALQALLDAL